MPDPATATITPLDQGGVSVTVTVPTYEGTAAFNLTVERDGDGEWHVFIPWPDDMPAEYQQNTVNGHDAAGGIVYLGAPDLPEGEC